MDIIDSIAQPATAVMEAPARPATSKIKSAVRKQSIRLYAVIWRWHFIAGLLVTPILITVALMGSLYLFKDELEPLIHPAILTVTPQPTAVAYAEQWAAVQTAYPKSKITSIEHHADPGRAVRFALRTAENQRIDVYVNQYSGQVLGQLTESTGFFGTVLKIHRNLFAGTPGRIIVELMVCWTISTMLTGMYLGWKRIRKDGLRLRPRLRGQTSRSFLRELHIFGGAYLGITALLIMLTGLLFTSVSGDLIKQGLAAQRQPAALTTPPQSAVQPGGRAISMDAALATYLASGATAEWRMQVPAKDTATYIFSANTSSNLSAYRRAWVDQYSGLVLADVRWQDLPIGTQITRYFYPIHTGEIFGLPTKILALLTCLMLITLSVTGVQMWWKRRPAGRSGVPARVQEKAVPRGLVVVIIGMAILLPLMGASLVVVLLGDWLVGRFRRRREVRAAIGA